MDNIAIITLGCKVNQAESEELALRLAAQGFGVTRQLEGAALCVVNTCAVTAEGDHKSRKTVAKALRAGIPVIATGCTVQTDPDTLVAAEGLRLVPNGAKESIAEMIADMGLQTTSAQRTRPELRTRAVIKVQDGCDRACAYCIVPRARGSSRSLPRPLIDRAVTGALQRGAAEIVLTGVNLGDYGRDHGASLPGLIRELTSLEGIGRLRLSSLEIDHLQGELLDEVVSNRKVCKHLHLPLQSGDDGILKAMGRRYGIAEVAEVVAHVRRSWREAAITLDVMVGFPGEGETEFANTLAALEELRPSKLHVFQYSPRPGTRAYAWAQQTCTAEKKERARRARLLGQRLQESFVKAQVGTRTEVAILDTRAREGTVGLTGNYVKVLLEPCGEGSTAGLHAARIHEARGCLAVGSLTN